MLTAVLERTTEPALSISGHELSYGELRAAAAALIPRLGDAERVAVWAQPTLEAVIGAVAAVCAGIPLVPVNPQLGRSELEHVLSDSRPDVILGVGDGELPELAHSPERLTVDVTARATQLPATQVGDEDPALIIYTSGTTGRPKGAILSRRAIAANLDALAEAWEWTDRDVLAHSLPLFHVHGLVVGTFGPLRLGGQLRHLGRFDPTVTAAALRDGATMLFGVPTMYHRLGREAEQDAAIADGLSRARLLVSGSAPLPAPEFERIRRLTGQRIVERYGLTETLMNTAVRADGERRPGYVGRPLPGIDLRLLDDDGSDLDIADDETIGRRRDDRRGPRPRPQPVLGLSQPARCSTDEAMRDGWFATGDLATRSPGTDTCGSWGVARPISSRPAASKVGAGEIEVALLDHPAVLEVAVTGEPDPDLGEADHRVGRARR